MSTIEKAIAKIGRQGAVEPGVADSSTGWATSAGRQGHVSEGAITDPGRVQHLALERLRAQGLLTPDAKRSQLAEEYRLIKRPLLMNVDKKGADIVDNANMIMVTSALPGEGKTFSAINLAMSIAMERDRTVLLVDGDVAKPTAAKRLGIEAELGLTDLLDGSCDSVADVLVHADVANMRILPAGRRHERATELLASERMSMVMAELSTRYSDRVVIFDSPPLLLASESAVLAEMMGQVIMVVAAEQTGQHAVNEGLARLGEDKIIGLLLNKYRPGLGNRYGTGYRYGYGYGYGYGQAPTADESAAQPGV
ncbi:XrtA-associated tyrosine autokinase [Marichromatium sp. AB31]|uniref:XrtA-associated tyrosine autokinase n=1 Tax=Marichromatium sp. AB31 TaxID=2483362 RepID=UPI000F3E6786|nr:XrtA-associated tyrosine autokinase [Marichromatium sp. AB31]RNE90186.1 tyrosine-protein kinase family protein [Marichromatium sp. AB31]